MTPQVHPTAFIDPTATLADDVRVDAYCVIGPQVSIEAGCHLKPHTVIESHARIGSNNVIGPHATLAGPPQDLTFDANTTSWIEVGNNCTIREYVTIHRATGENSVTRLGNDCYLMAYAHLGHNAVVGDRVILANGVQLGGYAEVGDGAFLGGLVAVHQFCRVGKLAVMGGSSATRSDVPPFSKADGRPSCIYGINSIGLRRAGFNLASRERLRHAYQLLFNSALTSKEAIEQLAHEDDAYVQELVEFVRSSKRGICRSGYRARQGGGSENEASSSDVSSNETPEPALHL